MLSRGSIGIVLTLLLGGCSALEGSRFEEGRTPSSGERHERAARITAKAELPAKAVPVLLNVEQLAEPIIEDGREEPASESGANALDPDQALVATAQQTFVYQEPNFDSQKLGYLRAGAVVARSKEASGFEGCKGGFYRVEPQGYVCAGPRAALDRDHILTQALIRRADRAAPLPYSYGLSRLPPPPLYTRIPTVAEQELVEKGFHRTSGSQGLEEWKTFGIGPIPDFLQDGQSSLRSNGTRQSSLVLQAGRAIPKSGFALLNLFQANDRVFGLSADLSVIPLDRLRPIEPSRFHGLPLDQRTTLPVVFVRSKSAYLYSGDPKGEGLQIRRTLDFREVLPISGQRVVVGRKAYLQTTSGDWLLDERLLRVNRIEQFPSWVRPGRGWIDVSILNQSLVAYEGETPVFVTLVSTGVDGLGDPEKTHSTIRGRFLIHTKLVTATMDGDEVGDEFDLRDVPYVQYFKEGYALHAAYWHDAFGTPRSHGCINLSPQDAHWLFGWTAPAVPTKWHAAMSLRDGTQISIHP